MSREAGGPLEPSLVARARAGDVDAFEQLVRERADRVVRLAMAIVADETEARDVAQETFITAWRQLADLRDEDRFEAWLTRIVVNKARMALRSRRRRRVREIPAAELTTTVAEGHTTDRPDEDAGRLAGALDALDPDRRAILALHHLEGWSVAEIAATLEIPVGTAKSRLFAARQALERAFAEADR
jgi:RNA polymerase sigma-70 factor, ECF subfamily